MGIALITGASAGLGVEFAKLFAYDGHSIVLVARRRDAMETLAKELRILAPQIRVDVVDMDLGLPGAGTALFKKVAALGFEVEYLVNNAGFGSQGSFSGRQLERELQMIDLNIRTLVELTHLYLAQMLNRKSGRILNVGSTAGFQPGPYMATYYASKAFVNSFSEALHEELKGSGVTCTVLAPGATATEFAKTSGVDKSRLFDTVTATPRAVALAGYNAMMNGQAMVVPGTLNKLTAQSVRLAPRSVARKLAGYLNRDKN